MRPLVRSALLVALTWPQIALADDKHACVDAYQAAQRLRNKGDYTAAREQLLICAREVCPAIVKHDCVPWLGEITRGIASILVSARDPKGNPLAACTVKVDGRVVATQLDGRPIEISPGAHTVRVEAEGGSAEERSITLGESQRNHAIDVVLSVRAPVEEAPPTKTSRPIPAGAIALGAVGVVGMGAFATLGLLGIAKKSSLDVCKPACNPSDVGVVRNEFIAADVAVSIGGAALIGAAVWFLLRPQVTTTVSAALFPGGGVLSFVRRF